MAPMAGKYRLLVARTFLFFNVLTVIAIFTGLLGTLPKSCRVVGDIVIRPGLRYYLYCAGAVPVFLGHR